MRVCKAVGTSGGDAPTCAKDIASTGCSLVVADKPCIVGLSPAKQSSGMVTFVSGSLPLLLQLLMLLLQPAVRRCMLTRI